MNEVQTAVEVFLKSWAESPDCNKQGFVRLAERVFGQQGVVFEFIPRPGVTYSLRASIPGRNRPLFVMIDVIED